MSQFKSPLQVQAIDDNTWVMLSPLSYDSDHLGRLVTVPKGFVTDFASVPRLPVAFMLEGDRAHMPAVIHDFLYSSDCLKADADLVLAEAMTVTGQPWWRVKMFYWGVRMFGETSYEADQAKKKKLALAEKAKSIVYHHDKLMKGEVK
jgi:Protein of unknown function (DUF1353)